MENFIVFLIVAGAVWYIGRLFYKDAKKEEGCGCSCSSCGLADECSGIGDKTPEKDSRL